MGWAAACLRFSEFILTKMWMSKGALSYGRDADERLTSTLKALAGGVVSECSNMS